MQQEPKTTIKYTEVIHVFGIAAGLLASCILVSGYALYLGYVSTFGLDTTLMNRGLGDVIAESWYVGLLALVYLLGFWWYSLVFVAVVGSLMLAALCYVARQREKGRDPIGDPITKQNPGRKILGLSQWHWINWGQAIQAMSAWAIVPAVVLLIGWSFLVLPYSEGKTNARKAIDGYQKRGCKTEATSPAPARCISLVEVASSTPLAAGLLVSATSERVAIFGEEGLQVWPLTSHYRIDRAYAANPNAALEP